MKILAILAFLVLLPIQMAFVTPVFAQVDIDSEVCSGNHGTGEVPAICGDIQAGEDTNPIYGPDGILTRAISVLSVIVAIISIIVIIISGIKMSLSQGDPGKINSSRNQLIYALVALAVAIAAQAVVRFIISKV